MEDSEDREDKPLSFGQGPDRVAGIPTEFFAEKRERQKLDLN